VALGLDHLVVAARTLEEGGAWVRQRLGVVPVAGGKHAAMGTHNHLLGLDRGQYLEVIAVDPAAPAPPRPRWFGLDSNAMRARLAAGPALVHWVVRTDDLEGALADYPEPVEILHFERGNFRWRMGVPRDGRIPCDGQCPTLIQWEEGPHPSETLPPSGCSLLEFHTAGTMTATFATPAGIRTLP
jgi:hypothetical protein